MEKSGKFRSESPILIPKMTSNVEISLNAVPLKLESGYRGIGNRKLSLQKLKVKFVNP